VIERETVDLDRCFQILEIDRHASIEEARQAYKDVVNVWHPDRFSENPRLRAKAEKKLKQINAAYERVQSHLRPSSEQCPAGKAERGAKRASVHEYGVNGEIKAASGARTEPPDLTEAAFEVGTRLALTFWSYLSKRFHEVIEGGGTSSGSKRGARSK
jgi:curved DNA-binding protein CbpA